MKSCGTSKLLELIEKDRLANPPEAIDPDGVHLFGATVLMDDGPSLRCVTYVKVADSNESKRFLLEMALSDWHALETYPQ